VKDPEIRPSHQPQVERGDIRVADKRLRVPAEDLRFEVRDHADSPVAARAADHGLDPRIEPHSHEVLGPALVLVALEAAHRGDFGVEDHPIAGPFQGADSPAEPAGSG
jgi:hypothetical protein